MQWLLTYPEEVLIISFDPFLNIETVLGYSETITGIAYNRFVEKEIRYSNDNISWSSWMSLTNYDFSKICSYEKLYFQVKYTRKGTSNEQEIIISDPIFDVTYKDSVIVQSIKQSCCNACEIENYDYYFNTCDSSSFNPYSNMDTLIAMNKKLNEMVNSIYGICVRYYKTDPIAEDVVLNEYTLYNVSSQVDMTIVLPDNELPDSKITYTPLDMDFQDMPFQIHIPLDYWWCLFGKGTMPQERDYLYIPITDRYYQVQSSWIHRGIMNQPSYFIAALEKYQNRQDIYVPDEFSIEDTIVSQAEFNDERELEFVKITKPKQFKPNNTHYDFLRKGVDPLLKYAYKDLSNYFTVFSKHQYLMQSIPPNLVAVKYTEKPKFETNTNYSFHFWINIRKPKTGNSKKTISNISSNVGNNNFSIVTFINKHEYVTGDYIKINGVTAYNGLYLLEVIDDYNIRIEKTFTVPYTGTTSQVYSLKSNEYYLIYGYDNNEGLAISYIDSGIVVNINTKTYIFNVDDSVKFDKWYGLVVNLNNMYCELNVNLWEPISRDFVPVDKNNSHKMKNLYSDTLKIEPESVVNYGDLELISNNYEMTNIRIYNKTAEVEVQSNMLTQYIVNDSQFLLLQDDGMPPLQTPISKNNK